MILVNQTQSKNIPQQLKNQPQHVNNFYTQIVVKSVVHTLLVSFNTSLTANAVYVYKAISATVNIAYKNRIQF